MMLALPASRPHFVTRGAAPFQKYLFNFGLELAGLASPLPSLAAFFLVETSLPR